MFLNHLLMKKSTKCPIDWKLSWKVTVKWLDFRLILFYIIYLIILFIIFVAKNFKSALHSTSIDVGRPQRRLPTLPPWMLFWCEADGARRAQENTLVQRRQFRQDAKQSAMQSIDADIMVFYINRLFDSPSLATLAGNTIIPLDLCDWKLEWVDGKVSEGLSLPEKGQIYTSSPLALSSLFTWILLPSSIWLLQPVSAFIHNRLASHRMAD